MTDAQVERFVKKLGADGYSERISLVQKYEEKWELSEMEFQQSLSGNNLIFYAVSKQYGRVIFKILINNSFDKEILALKLFQGRNFCKLYEYSLEDRVYIMERIMPGTTLYEGTTHKERIEIAAEIFQGLHKPNMPDAVFPAYIEWFEEGKNGVKNREDCAPLRHYLVKAEQIIWDISKKYPRKLLLHGDLHHENILKNETGGYTVIDPKGVIGDPVFDLSRFILDEFRDDLTAEPRDVIMDFIKALGNSVGISYEVLLQCLYVETVIWLFREELASGESLDECESLIANMKAAYKLLKDEAFGESG